MADVVIQGVTIFMTEGMEAATLLALVAGVLLKTWGSYIKVKAKDPTITFDTDYLLTALLPVLMGATTIAQLAPAAPTSVLTTVGYLAFIFGSGYGLNHIVNEKVDTIWEAGHIAPR